MREIRLTDEYGGEISEVLVNYIPNSQRFIMDLIDWLPESEIYVAHGYTTDDLEERTVISMANIRPENWKYAEKFPEFMAKNPFMAELFMAGPSVAQYVVEHSGLEGGDLDYVKGLINAYCMDGGMQESVNLIINYFSNKNGRMGYREQLDEVKAKAPDRVHLIPIEGLITGFARDRVLAGTSNGKKVLVQGKVDYTSEAPSIHHYMDETDLKITESGFWEGRFDIVPNTDIPIMVYEGGDIRVSDDTVFVGPNTPILNCPPFDPFSNGLFTETLKSLTGRGSIFIAGKTYRPALHLDTYLSPLNDRSVMLGDMRETKNVMEKYGLWKGEHQKTFEDFQPHLERVAKKLKKNGFAVHRMPLYARGTRHTFGGMDMRSYANEIRSGKRVLVAGFGIDELDRTSTILWKGAGYDVTVLDTMGSIESFERVMERGSISIEDRIDYSFSKAGVRCCVNVLSRR